MTSIFVAKLDFGVTSEELKRLFQTYGAVLKANVAIDKETGKSRGFGFVEMADRDAAMEAIKALDGHMINGRPIAVKEAEQRGNDRGPSNNRDQRPQRSFDGQRSRDNQRPPHPNRENNRGDQMERPPIPRDIDDNDTPYTPPVDLQGLKGEPRKKVSKDKKKDFDGDDRSKKTKLSPYKKSGKSNRFYDDDDDDFDPENDSLFNFGDEEEDDWDNEEDED
jgi:RNA recognition motif-containing protein